MSRNDCRLIAKIKIVIFEWVSERQYAKWTKIVKFRTSRSTIFIFSPSLIQKLLDRISLNFRTIYAVNVHIEVTISHSVSQWQSDKCRKIGNFATILPQNWLPWQHSLRNQKSKKLDRIEKVHANSFHLVKNRENRSSRYWDSFAHI